MRPLTLKLFLMDLASKLQQHVFPCVAILKMKISVNLGIQKVEVGVLELSGERQPHVGKGDSCVTVSVDSRLVYQ